MENIRNQFRKELDNLEIGEDEALSVKLVGRRFRKKALKVHSDKTRGGDDEEFKELLNDYHRVIEALEQLGENKEMSETMDMHAFFEKHNFAKEFSQSWTIFVEKKNVENWKIEMAKRYPDSKQLQYNGTQYKSLVDGKYVFTTLYDVMIPKMNIQGSHSIIRKFVIDVLPDIYREVSKGSPHGSAQKEVLPLNARIKLAAEVTYTCDVCEKKYVRKTALKRHIEQKHDPQITPPSRNPVQAISVESTSTQEGVCEEEGDLLEERIITKEAISLEENSDVIEESGPHQIETNYQCGECGNMFDVESQMNEHVCQDHIPMVSQYQCDECGNVFCNESLLREHKTRNHSEVLNFQCRVCQNNYRTESQLSEHIKTVHEDAKKELELLKRRHEALKEKYDEAVNKNKEYAKKLFNCLKENTELKDNAEKDAETLADTLNMNQVLLEEIKVKDEIIKADQKIKETEVNINVINVEHESTEQSSNRNVAKCNKCDWTSLNPTHLAGHMLKHTGQYVCGSCKSTFLTKDEMGVHERIHTNRINENSFKCITCDKEFQAQHSLKQHLDTKHRKNTVFPVGHPDRYHNQKKISCHDCNMIFNNEREIHEHKKEHMIENNKEENYQFSRKDKVCRYFRRGFCVKGEDCVFKHISNQSMNVAACRKGQECKYFYQNRCKFYHDGERDRVQTTRVQKACRYKEECWNIRACRFSHQSQGFQFAQRTNIPPQNMNLWIDY